MSADRVRVDLKSALSFVYVNVNSYVDVVAFDADVDNTVQRIAHMVRLHMEHHQQVLQPAGTTVTCLAPQMVLVSYRTHLSNKD